METQEVASNVTTYPIPDLVEKRHHLVPPPSLVSKGGGSSIWCHVGRLGWKATSWDGRG